MYTKANSAEEYELTTQEPSGAKWYFDSYRLESRSLAQKGSSLSAIMKHRK
jgi:hypothetical protein